MKMPKKGTSMPKKGMVMSPMHAGKEVQKLPPVKAKAVAKNKAEPIGLPAKGK
jgi:hypothetical protein